MRIAVLYSGFLRIWERALLTNRAYLFTEETDLYFYTYNEPTEVPVKQFIKIPTPVHKEQVFYDTRYYDKVRELHEDNKFYNPYPPAQHANILQQWHNSFVGFCIVPEDYDVYVRSRGDVILHGKIDFHEFEYTDNRIFIPTGNDYYGINDQFAFGNYQAMKVYYNLYLDYFKDHGWQLSYQPEATLLEHVLKNKMEIVRLTIHNTVER